MIKSLWTAKTGLESQQVQLHNIEREHQQSGGRFVQAVHRVDPTPQLVAGPLQGGPPLVAIEVGPMHQHSGRLVDYRQRSVQVHQPRWLEARAVSRTRRHSRNRCTAARPGCGAGDADRWARRRTRTRRSPRSRGGPARPGPGAEPGGAEGGSEMMDAYGSGGMMPGMPGGAEGSVAEERLRLPDPPPGPHPPTGHRR